MRLLRRIAGLLGLSRDEDHSHGSREGGRSGAAGSADEPTSTSGAAGPPAAAATGASARGGFSVQVPVAVESPVLRPLLVPCEPGEGGVQGFKWYTRRLRIDEDGDVANEFLDEIAPTEISMENSTTLPKFQLKNNTQPTAMAMRKQVIAVDGNIHQRLEYQGKLRWV